MIDDQDYYNYNYQNPMSSLHKEDKENYGPAVTATEEQHMTPYVVQPDSSDDDVAATTTSKQQQKEQQQPQKLNPYRQHYYKREADDSSQSSQESPPPPKKRAKRSKNLDWKEMYERLVAYKAAHGGSVRVPQGYKADPALGRWVHGQRYHCKCPAKRAQLDEIGFEWKPIKVTEGREWMDVYKRLVAFKNRYGHADVPQRWKEDLALGRWVHRQRYDCKDSERIKLLNAVGYDWLPPKERKWMDMYGRLKEYQQIYQTTDVDRSIDKELFHWANAQRENCKSERRASLLTKIDFDWPELCI